ncbi:MAG: hypothetical protein ACSLE8_06170 [Rhodococcus sp. (in: high G+C Gram-positive bacteria)]
MTHPKIKHYLDLAATAANLDDARWYAKKASAYATTIDLIEACKHEGKLLVIESGRDCDCVEYSGRRHEIDATLEAFEALDDEIGGHADGPYELEIVPFNTRTEYQTSDLVLEAMENGHPHCVMSRFG